jgi:hypothetical protein
MVLSHDATKPGNPRSLLRPFRMGDCVSKPEEGERPKGGGRSGGGGSSPSSGAKGKKGGRRVKILLLGAHFYFVLTGNESVAYLE